MWKYKTIGRPRCTHPAFEFGTVLRSTVALQWRHNGCDGVSNHQPHDCLLNRLFRRRSKNTSKLRVTGLCAGNAPVTGEFTAQMASNAENASIWWRHHEQTRRRDAVHRNLYIDVGTEQQRTVAARDAILCFGSMTPLQTRPAAVALRLDTLRIRQCGGEDGTEIQISRDWPWDWPALLRNAICACVVCTYDMYMIHMWMISLYQGQPYFSFAWTCIAVLLTRACR